MLISFILRIFDSEGEGFIPVERFRLILIEVDEDFTEAELDDIIAEVCWKLYLIFQMFPPSQIDADGSGTIDFEEFVKIMN